MTHYQDIIASYMPAARLLGLTPDQVEGAVRLAATKQCQQRHCPSCQFSRARHDVMEVAETQERLPIYERRCVFQKITGLVYCQSWQRLELPSLVTLELEPMAA